MKTEKQIKVDAILNEIMANSESGAVSVEDAIIFLATDRAFYKTRYEALQKMITDKRAEKTDLETVIINMAKVLYK